MGALAKNYNRIHKEAISEKELKVKAAAHIFRGAAVMVIIGTGYIIPAADTANGRFKGVALFEANNVDGSDGDIRARIMTEGEFPFTLTGVTIADLGKFVYAVSDNEVCLTGQTNDVVVGKVSGIKDTNLAWIDIGDRKNILTAYRQNLITEIVDISTAQTIYVPVNFAGTITRISTVLYGTIATADGVVTCYIGAVAITTGELTIGYDGSAAGNIATVEPTAANVVAQGDYIKIINADASTNAIRVTVNIEITVNV